MERIEDCDEFGSFCRTHFFYAKVFGKTLEIIFVIGYTEDDLGGNTVEEEKKTTVRGRDNLILTKTLTAGGLFLFCVLLYLFVDDTRTFEVLKSVFEIGVVAIFGITAAGRPEGRARTLWFVTTIVMACVLVLSFFSAVIVTMSGLIGAVASVISLPVLYFLLMLRDGELRKNFFWLVFLSYEIFAQIAVVVVLVTQKTGPLYAFNNLVYFALLFTACLTEKSEYFESGVRAKRICAALGIACVAGGVVLNAFMLNGFSLPEILRQNKLARITDISGQTEVSLESNPDALRFTPDEDSNYYFLLTGEGRRSPKIEFYENYGDELRLFGREWATLDCGIFSVRLQGGKEYILRLQLSGNYQMRILPESQMNLDENRAHELLPDTETVALILGANVYFRYTPDEDGAYEIESLENGGAMKVQSEDGVLMRFNFSYEKVTKVFELEGGKTYYFVCGDNGNGTSSSTYFNFILRQTY